MSSVLARAIKFSALCDDLSDVEFAQLLSKIVARLGRGVFMTTLFEQFRDETNADGAEAAIGAIHGITKSRQQTPETGQQDVVEMHALPTDLIGEIGSYLKQSEYFAFSRISRATFVGCSSPCTLKELDLTKKDSLYRPLDYSRIYLQNFPQIRSLHFDITQFHKFKFPPTGKVCTHLYKVRVSGDGAYDCDLGPFMSSTAAIDFSSVTHLTLHYFGDDGSNDREDGTFSIPTFKRLLSRFEGAPRLVKFDDVWIEWDADLSPLLPNLIGLHTLQL